MRPNGGSVAMPHGQVQQPHLPQQGLVCYPLVTTFAGHGDTKIARLAAALALALALSACSGPFFYHDVIVPTDPNRHPPPPSTQP